MGRAWELVCDKRSECDIHLGNVPGVAFFFSAISSRETQTKKEGKKTSEQKDCADEEEDDNIMSSQRTLGEASTSSTINTAVEKGRLPAISYWVAFESPNGAPISLVRMHRQLLKCEVEIDTKVLTTRNGAPGEIVKNLCTVLKDHNSSYIGDIVNASFQSCFIDATQDIDNNDDLDDVEEELRECALRFVLVKPSYAKDEKRGTISAKEITTDQCTQLINDIEILMTRLGYAMYEGAVYRKDPRSRYTYSYKCDVSSFIGTLEGNESFRSRLVKFGEKVKERIKNPKSQLIRQIKVLHDLIEVKDGWCLSISKRRFIKEPISKDQVGKFSPRAYFHCDHDILPDAKFFREILENSLSNDQIKDFCNDFLNLLKFQGKQHKEKVPCLVGDANSGKTSLFAPILGVIPPSKIARVTKQKSFNKAMIDEQTEVIFVDEASVDIMDIDDWKILTQGGWTAHDRKFSTARGFVNRCPMLLTCQKELKFPKEDQPAMDARLNIYQFKRLPNKDPMAHEWLKTHPVECITWAINHAGALPVTETNESSIEDRPGEQTLSIEDEQELYTFNLDQCGLDVDDADAEYQSSLHVEESSEVHTSSESTRTETLQEKLKEFHPKSFRGRLFTKLVERADAASRMENETMQRMVQSRRRRLIEEGIVNEEEALEFIQDPIHALPTQIQKRRYEILGREKEKRRVEMLEKNVNDATSVFKNPWVLQKEREMFEYCKEREQCHDVEMRTTLECLVEITENKLKQFHEKSGTMHKEAVKERKKVVLSLGYVCQELVEEIKNVYHRLPMIMGAYIQMTPPRSELGDDGIIPDSPQTPSWSAKETTSVASPELEPPKTPSWSAKETTSVASPEMEPPKTPSWSPNHSSGVMTSPFRLTKPWSTQPILASHSDHATFLSQRGNARKRATSIKVT
ncbi:hypothetical protein QZH41_008196, partial [Actinostola sp. cb2023]